MKERVERLICFEFPDKIGMESDEYFFNNLLLI